MNPPNEVFFRPTMAPGESPGSILLRLSGAHFERPTAFLGRQTHKTYILSNLIRDLIKGDVDVVDGLIDRKRWQPPSLYRELSNHPKHRKWYNFKRAKVCPDCAEEDSLPLYQDLYGVEACAKHGWTLITSCSDCGADLNWNRPHLQYCNCHSLLDTRKPAHAIEVEAARLHKEWLYNGDIDRLQTYNEVKRLLKKRFGVWPEAQHQALAFVQGDSLPLADVLARFVVHPDSFSARAVVAPFTSLSSARYKEAITAIVENLVSRPPSSPTLPSAFYLTRQEIGYMLGATWRVVDEVVKGHLSDYRNSKLDKRYAIMSKGVEALLHALHIPSEVKQGPTIRELVTLHRISSGHWLNKLLAGETRLVAPGDTLLDIRVDEPDTVESSVPDGYVTLPQASEYLELYPEAIRRMMKSGLLDAEIQLNHNRRYIFPKATLDNFLRTYITGAQLADRLSVEPRRFAERLIAAGATPVSGPSIDKCNIYVFRREEVEDRQLISQALSLDSYSKSGRRRDDAPSLDESIWAGATEAAEYLCTSVAQLSYLESVSPLTEAYPELKPSGSRRYYRWETVRATKTFLDKLVDIDLLTTRTGLSRPKLLRRIGRLFKSPLIVLNSTTYVSSADANKIELHCKRYWCADVASKYLGRKRHDINNWRKLGHLQAINRDHPGFIEGIHLYESRLIKKFRAPKAAYQQDQKIRG